LARKKMVDKTDKDELQIGDQTRPRTKLGSLDDHARFVIAILFSVAYILMVLVLFFHGLMDFDQQKITAIMAVIVAPLGTLVGGIVGFYFGTKKER
jgi:membrane protein DedA with SNARE-associated domain